MIALGEIALANADQKTRKNVLWIGHGDPLLSDPSVGSVDRDRFLKWITNGARCDWGAGNR